MSNEILGCVNRIHSKLEVARRSLSELESTDWDQMHEDIARDRDAPRSGYVNDHAY